MQFRILLLLVKNVQVTKVLPLKSYFYFGDFIKTELLFLVMLGQKWYKDFMKKQPTLSKSRAQNMNVTKTQKLNPFIVGDYYEKLGKFLGKMNLLHILHKIYNMDEKGYRLTTHLQQSVVVQMVLNLYTSLLMNMRKILRQCLGSCNIFLIIFKGKDSLLVGSTVIMAAKGSMTVDVCLVWLDHITKFKSSSETV